MTADALISKEQRLINVIAINGDAYQQIYCLNSPGCVSLTVLSNDQNEDRDILF